MRSLNKMTGLTVSPSLKNDCPENGAFARYDSVLESIDQGYFETDLDGGLTFFNNSFKKLFDYPEDRMTGFNIRDLTDNYNWKKISAVFKTVYDTGNPNKGFVWEYVRKDGAIRHIGSSISLLLDGSGKPAGFRGIARDISERKKEEDQHAQKRKLEAIGRLAAGIAHEINTPTQYVGDNTQFLKDAFHDLIPLFDKCVELLDAVKQGRASDRLIEDVEKAVKQADLDYLREEIPPAIEQSLEGLERISRIVQAMKEFSHPGTAQKIPTDINRAIKNTITISRNEWKYVADIETDFDENLPHIPCLPGEFNQAVLNMIINGAHSIADVIDKESGEKGKILISTEKAGDEVVIRIGDTGKGIPEMIRPMIFEPFFTTKGAGKGTGQGLAITHAVIVHKLGGSIRFETETGKGAVFIIHLPVSDPHETAPE